MPPFLEYERGAIMQQRITMGKPESKRCATCEFWDGPRSALIHRGLASSPKEFFIDSQGGKARCIKTKLMCLATYKCW